MIKFGPSGNSESFRAEGYTKTEQAAKWLKDRNLDYFEYSFGRGILMSDEKAEVIKQAFLQQNIGISVHAPYFINLATPEEEKAINSFNYILNSADKVLKMGGNRVIFHPAAQGKATREVAVQATLDRIKILRDLIYENNLDNVLYCPETMGKLGQIGTIEEVTEFCKVDKIFIPTIDFGHVNARENGSLKIKEDYKSRLEYMIENLGMEKMKNFHVHFSKIEYSVKGEIRHLTFEDKKYGPEFEPLAEALIELDLEPVIICESAGTQAEDAMCMKNAYFNIKNNIKV